MGREEILEVEIGKIQERLEKSPKETSEEELSWLRQQLEEFMLELNKLYVESMTVLA